MKRILIIRLSALGDVVMATGLIPALRQRYPDAQLSWLVEPAAAPLIKHNPQLDEVIVWPRTEWQQLWRERAFLELWRHMRSFRLELRARRFDLVLDAQGLLKSGFLAWLTGASARMGLLSREGSQWLMTEQVTPTATTSRVIGTEYRFLGEHLGASADAFQLDLAIGDTPRTVAAQALQDAGIIGPYAVLCPFTTRPQKHWLEERWAALSRQLLQQGLSPLLLGGPDDLAAAQRIVRASPGLISLTAELKLDESVAVIAGSTLLIGVDTGLTHMGSALNIPTVALFGSTCPYRDAGPSTVVLYEPLACSPCKRKPTCGGRFDCMRLHSVETVFNTAMRLLEAA